jgi:hypothetical protein
MISVQAVFEGDATVLDDEQGHFPAGADPHDAVMEAEAASHDGDALAFLRKDGGAPARQPPSCRLYSPWSVGLAVFLGTLASGAMVLAVNYWRLRRRLAAAMALVVGTLATAGLGALAVVATSTVIGLTFRLALGLMGHLFLTAAAGVVADTLQGKAVRRHLLAGGKMASAGGTVLIACALMAVAVPLVWQVDRCTRQPFDALQRGREAETGGDLTEAASQYSRAVALRPRLREAYWRRGAVHLRQRDDEAALADFDRAVQLSPEDPRGYLERARAMLMLRAFGEAADDLTRVTELAPEDQDAFYLRAEAYAQLKKFSEAIEDCTTAIRIREHPRSYELRSRCYQSLGEWAKARADRKAAEALRRKEWSP